MFYIIFHLFVLYLLVRVFVLYLLCGCLIPNTLMWSLYTSWFQGPNIHLLFFLVSLSWISFLVGMTPIIRSLNFWKDNSLSRLGHEISYHFICGVPLYIQFLITDTVSDEKENNVDVLGTVDTWWPPIILQENGSLIVLVKKFCDLLSLDFHKILCPAYIRHAVVDSKNIWFSWTAGV